jgi:type VI secretion system FHA domain protein
MQLALQVISSQAATLGQNASKVFGEAGGTIGRVPGNDWVLPDEERFVSGLHIIIRCMGGMFSLEDVSTNGTFLNDDPEAVGAKNEPVTLKSGDRIAIGDYQVYCNIIESEAEADISQPSPIPAMNVFEQGSGVDIEAPLSQQAVAPKADIIPPDAPGIGPVDPLDLLGDAPVQPVTAPATFPDHSSAMSDSFTAPEPASSAPPAAGAIPDDWDLADFSGDRGGAVQPEAPMVQSAASPIPPPATVGEIPDSAEKPVNLSGAESLYAELFPLIVQGMMDVLKSRAEIKNQFRLSVTTIKPVDNNPLKFSPTADAAIDQLFNKPQAGYLDATQAFEEGFGDIKAHQLAMMAGMRAAFGHMLKQFSPDVLEEYFESGGKRGKLLGMGSKSRYWDMYRDFFDRTTRDSDDNFRRLFGEEFAEAYEQQMQQLTRKS